MADNISVSTASGTEVVGADEISSVKYQRAKLIYGPDGTNSGDVQEASTTIKGPLPVNAYHASDYLIVAGLGIVPAITLLNVTADASVVAAVASKKLRCVSMYFTVTTAGTLQLKTGGSGGTNIGGVMKFADVGQFVLPFNPMGWFEGTVGNDLYMDITTITVLAGAIVTIAV